MNNYADDEIITKLVEATNLAEDEIKEYLRASDEYLDTLPVDVTEIDGDEQLEYVYQHADLDPSKIEKIANAEFDLCY